MTKWKATESDFEFIEDEVKLYPLYKKRLNQAINDYYHSTPSFDNNGGGKSNLPGRPVENIMLAIMQDARIMKLRLYVDSVEQAFNELDDEKKRFMERFFWKGASLQAASMEFCISKSTANRWRRAFLLRVGLLTGDKRDVL